MNNKYRVKSVLGTGDNETTAKAIEEALNQLDAEGYEPVEPRNWVKNGHHLLIAATRRET